ncbi:unnamed protein product, partial [Symbiodinium sp. KB8]
ALLPFASGSGSAPIVRLLEQLPDGAAAPQQPPVFLEWQAWDAERLKEYKTLLLLALTEFHARVGHVPARRYAFSSNYRGRQHCTFYQLLDTTSLHILAKFVRPYGRESPAEVLLTVIIATVLYNAHAVLSIMLDERPIQTSLTALQLTEAHHRARKKNTTLPMGPVGGITGCTRSTLYRSARWIQKECALAEVNSHSVAEVEALANQEVNEVHMVMSLSAALRSGSSAAASEVMAASALSHDKALVGALDSACNRTCAGEEWILGYLQSCRRRPRKFNGATLPSGVRYRLPAVIAGNLVGIWVSCVPVPSLGLLLGRDLLDGLGGVLDFGRKTLRCNLFAGRPPVPLERLAAGHLALNLIPDLWPTVSRSRW